MSDRSAVPVLAFVSAERTPELFRWCRALDPSVAVRMLTEVQDILTEAHELGRLEERARLRPDLERYMGLVDAALAVLDAVEETAERSTANADPA